MNEAAFLPFWVYFSASFDDDLRRNYYVFVRSRFADVRAICTQTENTPRFVQLGGRFNYDSTAIRPYYDHSTLQPICSRLLHCGLLHCALASGAVYCNRSCLCVCGGWAGGVRTLLQPARAQCLRLSERFIYLFIYF